jgi:hypothetical protein
MATCRRSNQNLGAELTLIARTESSRYGMLESDAKERIRMDVEIAHTALEPKRQFIRGHERTGYLARPHEPSARWDNCLPRYQRVTSKNVPKDSEKISHFQPPPGGRFPLFADAGTGCAFAH